MTEDRLDLLRQSPLWRSLPVESLQAVSAAMQPAPFRNGEAILRQGEKGNRLHVLTSGRLGVRIRTAGDIVVDVAELRPGDVFGEMSLLTGDPASADVVALEDSETLSLDRGALNALVASHPNLLREFVAMVSRRLRTTDEAVADSRETEQELTRFLREERAGWGPKPGHSFSTEEPRYITPDVYIVKVDQEFVVLLNDEGLPRLRVSPYYRAILADKTGGAREVRDYVEGRMRSALWLIRSIEQRQRTVHKVATSLIKFQRGFLEKGITAIRPLTLKEVADDIGMHESTVSRVTTNKYVHTPQGLFELKYFFHRGVPGAGGGTVSSLKVKDLIHKLLTGEDDGRPLSDQKIVERLRHEHAIEIARRTVAKYRSQLKIPSSSRRKRY